MCNRKSFTETEKDIKEKYEHAKKKHAEAMEILEKYEEVTPLRKLHDHACARGGK